MKLTFRALATVETFVLLASPGLYELKMGNLKPAARLDSRRV